MDEHIGTSIRDVRKDARMTQAELAQKVGLATITIRQYETGKREPKFETLKKIASALNCEITSLLPTPKENPSYYKIVENDLTDSQKSYLQSLDEELIEERIRDIKERDSQLRHRLLMAFYSLTEKGQEIAVQRIEELTKIADYKQDFSVLDTMIEESQKDKKDSTSTSK